MGQQPACSRNEAEGAKILCLYNNVSSYHIYIFPISSMVDWDIGGNGIIDDHSAIAFLDVCPILADNRDRSDFLRELGLPGGLDKG